MMPQPSSRLRAGVFVPDWDALLRDDAPPIDPPAELKERIMGIVLVEALERDNRSAPDR